MGIIFLHPITRCLSKWLCNKLWFSSFGQGVYQRDCFARCTWFSVGHTEDCRPFGHIDIVFVGCIFGLASIGNARIDSANVTFLDCDLHTRNAKLSSTKWTWRWGIQVCIHRIYRFGNFNWIYMFCSIIFIRQCRSLQWLRGPNKNVELELETIRSNIQSTQTRTNIFPTITLGNLMTMTSVQAIYTKIKSILKNVRIVKPLSITCGLMVFQRFTGKDIHIHFQFSDYLDFTLPNDFQ